jgi:hypothetical protein
MSDEQHIREDVRGLRSHLNMIYHGSHFAGQAATLTDSGLVEEGLILALTSNNDWRLSILSTSTVRDTK